MPCCRSVDSWAPATSCSRFHGARSSSIRSKSASSSTSAKSGLKRRPDSTRIIGREWPIENGRSTSTSITTFPLTGRRNPIGTNATTRYRSRAGESPEVLSGPLQLLELAGLVRAGRSPESNVQSVPAVDCHDGETEIGEFLLAELLPDLLEDFVRHVGISNVGRSFGPR